MDFVYKKVTGTKIERPIIPIVVRNLKNQKAIKYYSLVDSGSDECIFDAEVGEAIGIDVKKGEPRKLRGVIEGEAKPFWMHSIEIEVGGWPYRVQAGFMYEIARCGYGILGQRGFFDQFKSVKFEKRRGKIEIKRLESAL